MSPWKYSLFVVPVLLCGCAQGFDRAALQERLNDGTLQSNDAEIAAARNLKPQLRFPCRIAVYLQPNGKETWRWTSEDKAMLESTASQLKKEGIASEVFPLPELLSGKGELKELRLAAAKCGADAVFLIHGASQTDSYLNFAAALNVTVVGGYLVPGSHRDSLFMIEGLLIDVDNGYIYTGIQAEGMGKIMRPTFVIEDKESIAKAKSAAIAQFGDEVLKRLRRMSGAPAYVGDVNRSEGFVGSVPAGAIGYDLDVPIRMKP